MTQLCKWVGSKRSVLDQIFAHIPRTDHRLIIPFLGGGSDALHAIEREWASGYVFSDANRDLITTYEVVRDQPLALLGLLQQYANAHDRAHDKREFYLGVRNIDPKHITSAERAARFLFLIGTAFNGLWRTNRMGKMNTPFGDRVFTLSEDKIVELNRVKSLLRGYLGSWAPAPTLGCQDFADTISLAGPGDVVYCDPPYIPASRTSSFTSYSGEFGLLEHRRLYDTCRAAAKRGARVFVSNSDTPETRETYRCYMEDAMGEPRNQCHSVAAPRRVSAKASGRGTVPELLIEVRA